MPDPGTVVEVAHAHVIAVDHRVFRNHRSRDVLVFFIRFIRIVFWAWHLHLYYAGMGWGQPEESHQDEQGLLRSVRVSEEDGRSVVGEVLDETVETDGTPGLVG